MYREEGEIPEISRKKSRIKECRGRKMRKSTKKQKKRQIRYQEEESSKKKFRKKEETIRRIV